MRSVGSLGFVVLLALSGCADDAEIGVEGLDGQDVASDVVPALDPALELLPDLTPHDVTVYLAPDGMLVFEEPAKARVPMTATFYDPGAVTKKDFAVPTWKTETLTSYDLVLSVKVILYLSSDQPQVAALPDGPAMAWLGTSERPGPGTPLAGPNPLLPGTVQKFEAELKLPPGGQVYRPGDVASLMVGYFYQAGAATPLQLHTGGDTASRLEVRLSGFIPPLPGKVGETTKKGNLNPGEAVDVDIPLGSVPARLEVFLDGVSTPERLDLDLTILDPSGTVIASSTSPNAKEGALLYAINLQSGTYKARVHNYQGAHPEYTLRVLVETATAAE